MEARWLFWCLIGLCIPNWVLAQTKGLAIYSVDRAHRIEVLDGSGGACVKNKDNAVLYRFARKPAGHVALSKSGEFAVEWITDGDSLHRANPTLTFFKNGVEVVKTRTEPSIEFELADWRAKGFLRGDSLYHQMAKNPFFLDGDRLFLGFKDGTLGVFSIKSMHLIYAGSGANHFMQNYYSIPSAPWTEVLK